MGLDWQLSGERSLGDVITVQMLEILWVGAYLESKFCSVQSTVIANACGNQNLIFLYAYIYTEILFVKKQLIHSEEWGNIPKKQLYE